MVLLPQQQRRPVKQVEKNAKSATTGNHCSRFQRNGKILPLIFPFFMLLFNSESSRNVKEKPHRTHNAMTQTVQKPELVKTVRATQVINVKQPSTPGSTSDNFQWISASSSHKGMGNKCLNATEKVQAACQAVEDSAASLNSLVECIRNLPFSNETVRSSCLEAERDESTFYKKRHSGPSKIRPIGASSPITETPECRQSSETVGKELALLLEKVRHLKIAAAEADKELRFLRAENIVLKQKQQQHQQQFQQILKSKSPQVESPKVSQPEPEPVANSQTPKLSCSSNGTPKTDSPLSRYPNLRHLLLPATTDLLSEEMEDWVSSNKGTSTVDCPMGSTAHGSSPQSTQRAVSSAVPISASPFYSALRSADEGLNRLRLHLAATTAAENNFG